jgi:hypothetical protein
MKNTMPDLLKSRAPFNRKEREKDREVEGPYRGTSTWEELVTHGTRSEIKKRMEGIHWHFPSRAPEGCMCDECQCRRYPNGPLTQEYRDRMEKFNTMPETWACHG